MYIPSSKKQKERIWNDTLQSVLNSSYTENRGSSYKGGLNEETFLSGVGYPIVIGIM